MTIWIIFKYLLTCTNIIFKNFLKKISQIITYNFLTPKRHSLRKTTSFDAPSVKISPMTYQVSKPRNQKRGKFKQGVYILCTWGAKTPGWTNLKIFWWQPVDVCDIIMASKFDDDWFKGLGLVEGQSLPFAIDFDGCPQNSSHTTTQGVINWYKLPSMICWIEASSSSCCLRARAISSSLPTSCIAAAVFTSSTSAISFFTCSANCLRSFSAFSSSSTHNKCTKHKFIHFWTATFKALHIENSKNYKRWYCPHHTEHKVGYQLARETPKNQHAK